MSQDSALPPDVIILTSFVEVFVDSYELGELTYEKATKGVWFMLDDYEPVDECDYDLDEIKENLLYQAMSHFCTAKPEKRSIKSNRHTNQSIPPSLKRKVPTMVDLALSKNSSLHLMSEDRGNPENSVYKFIADRLAKHGFPEVTPAIIRNAYSDHHKSK